ncbi:MAG: hypothetical protein ACYC0Q_01435 [Eubacteriales bacterium]
MLEYVLSFIGMLLIAGLILLAGGLGLLLKLPPAITGLLAGIIIVVTMVRYDFAAFRLYTCPGCGATHKLIDEMGTYECSVCGNRSEVKRRKIENLYPTYPPTD